MRRRWVTLGVLVVGGAALFHFARARAVAHVRQMSGSSRETDVNCMRCHGGGKGGSGEQAARHATPWALAVTPDGQRLFVACGPLSEIAEIDVAASAVSGTLAMPGEPSGLALSPDGARLAVSLHDRDEVAVLDTVSRNVLATVAVGREPEGVAFDDSGRTLVVANGGSGDVSVVDLDRRSERVRLSAGAEPFAVARAPDGGLVAVVSRRVSSGEPDRVPACEITFVDPVESRVVRRVELPSAHMAEGAAFTADGRRLLVPVIVTRNLLPILQVERGWTMSTALAVVDVSTGDVVLAPLTDASGGLPDPAGIGVSADGRTAWVAAGGSDEVGLVDVPALIARLDEMRDGPTRLSMARHYLTRKVPAGSNPRGLVSLGDTFAVSERLDDAVAIRGRDGALVGRVLLSGHGQDDAVRVGERTFHDARYAFQGQFSCRSCHPGAHTDGLTYDFDIDGIGRNVVLNRSLHGVAGTEPFKWVGSNPTLHRQCGPRFAMVLSRADVFPDASLEALVGYLHSLPAPRPTTGAGRIDGRDIGAVERGRAIFERHERKDGTPIPASGRCITCHPPPLYTSKLKADVGTQGPYDDSALFDTPHLTGIATKAPYLHDGRARTLEEIWTLPGVGNSHGVVTDLGKADLNDLIQFLKGL